MMKLADLENVESQCNITLLENVDVSGSPCLRIVLGEAGGSC